MSTIDVKITENANNWTLFRHFPCDNKNQQLFRVSQIRPAGSILAQKNRHGLLASQYITKDIFIPRLHPFTLEI